MMKNRSYLFTSESVSEGHPDKICDGISDTLLDLYLSVDSQARVAIETLVAPNKVVLAGEVRSQVSIPLDDIKEAVCQKIRKIGYTQASFSPATVEILSFVHNQSLDIAQGVDASEDKAEGAGDQGIMFGYATNETQEFMPAPIYYAHKILEKLSALRHAGENRLGPDAKSQVTLRYQGGIPVGLDSLVVSTQHVEDMKQSEIFEIVRDIVCTILPKDWRFPEKKIYVNPTGRFVIGGPEGDCGLTGRKIIVDTYGGAAPHGGGAFSGKDPTKVDRSAAYIARYLAKNVVAASLAERCLIQLSYAIGIPHPLSVYLETFGTETVDFCVLEKCIQEVLDLSPLGIRKKLQLNRPIYEKTSSYGHFGRAPEENGTFSWEKTDLIDALKARL